MKNSINDNDLLKMLIDESTRREAFSILVNKYKQRLYWHIRKMVIVHEDADDILQNTFIKAWTNIDKFRGEANILTWLYRIATNETMDFFNSAHSKHSNNTVNLDDAPALQIENDVYFDGDEAQKKLQRAILSLPNKQRLVFNMRYYDEMPYAEMSEILGTSEGALKASYHHAVKKIEDFVTAAN
ncbi:MAG: RNA polymerase sigma factor [Paludibacteraceae bacterium]|jgi:RNA polymerase sigma-70 factor, ECF subfamily|nr:RNA polymerase sigma factor [Paludibacteraceae bacterium]OQA50627.1 MAG: ECF RNA polymerase sigma factor SigW [Bacteroidetes bacterium ADurb.Bin302]HOH95814.1 RNA polymerase sigma factor [Candidatus Enterocola sp.]